MNPTKRVNGVASALPLLMLMALWLMGGQVAQAQTQVRDVALGASHTCVLLNTGVKCFGKSNVGQLGLGDTNSRGDGANEMGASLPLVSLGRPDAPVAITAGANHTCVLFTDGKVKCWGLNTRGQLGLGDMLSRGTTATDMGQQLPYVDLGTNQKAAAISAGDSHTCALLTTGAVKCWGRNDNGQLGQGDALDRGDAAGEMGDALLPVALGTNIKATQVSSGGMHTCIKTDTNRMKCWGQGSSGQLGSGNTVIIGSVPGQMGDALPFVNLGTGVEIDTIRSGFVQSCVQLKDQSIKCFGYNVDGRLGAGDIITRGSTADTMGEALPTIELGAGLSGSDLQCGTRHCCATLVSQAAKCWGLNPRGVLGLEDMINRGSRVTDMGDDLPYINLGTLTTVRKIFPGDLHTCALLGSNQLKCWGANQHGQLGHGDAIDRGSRPGTMGAMLPAVQL